MKQTYKSFKDNKGKGIIQSLRRRKSLFLFGSLLLICCCLPISCVRMPEKSVEKTMPHAEYDTDDEILAPAPAPTPHPEYDTDETQNDKTGKIPEPFSDTFILK